MPGPGRKAAEKRQRRDAPPQVLGDSPALRLLRPEKAPPVPRGLLRKTRDWWKEFWASDLDQVVNRETDIMAVRRLATLYDERERAYRDVRKQRIVIGSRGQKVLSPLARYMTLLEPDIRQLEDRLGLTPRARMQLGIAMADLHKSLDDWNQRLEDGDEGTEDDPRL